AILEQYVNDQLLLLKLTAAEKAGKAGALIFWLILSGILSVFLLLFISLMGGFYFAEVTGSLFKGFAILTGIYLLLFIILFFLRKKILNGLVNMLIAKVFEKSNNADDGNNYRSTESTD
ncbi:MAG TPA: hypothetical protein VIK74_11745, partial [Parasegetibacter sp.]